MSFKINRVYTRTGDDGTTALIGGVRLSKSSPRVEAYGEVDELNATIGLALSSLQKSISPLIPSLSNIQQELFDLGSELARIPSENETSWVICAKHSTRLEQLCDELGTDLPELTSFILPAGSDSIARLHLARTVCRRAERHLVTLAMTEKVNPDAIRYLNRLSDFLFIACRVTHKSEGVAEVLWDQNPNRAMS